MEHIFNTKKQIERRDPCAPVLHLGGTLSRVSSASLSGIIELIDKESVHKIDISNGGISAVDGTSDLSGFKNVIKLFTLARPRIVWQEDNIIKQQPVIDPAGLIFKGITTRKDLFEPSVIAQRIPLSVLKIDESYIYMLKRLPVTKQEIHFFNELTKPTPVSMALYKRGLKPDYAASLVVALNILGVFKSVWAPGDLPRLTMAYQIIKKAQTGSSDEDLFNLNSDYTETELDRVFRLLSIELHPDKNLKKSQRSRQQAEDAFYLVSGVYDRLKSKISRRKRSVNSRRRIITDWQHALDAAEHADTSGNYALAKKFALSGISMSPPVYAKIRFIRLITKVA